MTYYAKKAQSSDSIGSKIHTALNYDDAGGTARWMLLSKEYPMGQRKQQGIN